MSARDPSKGLVGLFGGVSHGKTARDDQENTAQWVGVEAQKYFERATLYGQVGFAIGDVHSSPEEGFDKGYFARVVGRYFVDDDFRIQTELSYLFAEDAIDAIDDIHTYGWGLRADKRIGDSRFYGYAAYNGFYLDTATEGDKLTEHAVRLGVTRQFGPATLFAQDRYGATLDQPELVARVTNWIEPLD